MAGAMVYGELKPHMKIKKMPLSEIKPAPYNPRKDLKHGDPEYDALKRSILKFDNVEPLVVNERNNHLVGGHQRLKVLLERGDKETDVVLVDLDDKGERALNIALNKISGDWDIPKLKDILVGLDDGQFDVGLTGFNLDEIKDLVDWEAPNEGNTDADSVPEAPKKAITKPGDLWILGRHRLLCGDSTKEEDVASAVNGEHPVLMWTDPPYGVDYVGKTKKALTIKSDGTDGLEILITSAFKAADSILADGAAIYVAHPPGALSVVFDTCFVMQGWRLHETLIWVKDSMVLSRGDYHMRHENILYGWMANGTHYFTSDRTQTSIFEYPRPKKSDEHPTMKPVELWARVVGATVGVIAELV